MCRFDDPPEEWFECDVCDCAGEVFTGCMSHMVWSNTIDPPEPVMETCQKCGGAGGWIDERKPDTEADYCPYRHFTEEEEAAWERVFSEPSLTIRSGT